MQSISLSTRPISTPPISCVQKSDYTMEEQRKMLYKSKKSPCHLSKRALYICKRALHISKRGLQKISHQKEERFMQAGIEFSVLEQKKMKC